MPGQPELAGQLQGDALKVHGGVTEQVRTDRGRVVLVKSCQGSDLRAVQWPILEDHPHLFGYLFGQREPFRPFYLIRKTTLFIFVTFLLICIHVFILVLDRKTNTSEWELLVNRKCKRKWDKTARLHLESLFSKTNSLSGSKFM